MERRLAERVAEAADAWLRDPSDTNVYARLVDAVHAWRAHTHPMLEGTELLARRGGLTTAPAGPDVGADPDPVGGAQRQPQPLAHALDSVRAELARRQSAAAHRTADPELAAVHDDDERDHATGAS